MEACHRAVYQHPSTKSASTTEISKIHPQAVQSPTPAPEDRFSSSFKSLFTLAAVAAQRRANGSCKKITTHTDENTIYSDELPAASLAPLKRSKSSGDVAVLGDKSRCANAGPEAAGRVTPAKPTKVLRTRAATTPQSSPSRIPKVKSTAWLQTARASIEDTPDSGIISGSIPKLSASHELKVDDAVFVIVTPQTPKKLLTLAAHAPSLPRVASPFSPRTNQPCSEKRIRLNPTILRSLSTTGHTNASLHLTKSHWEFRYEIWARSRCKQFSPSMAAKTQFTPSRSRFPDPPTNPALFPRAGSLSPAALRPILDGNLVSDDARPALELDWAMRAWPLDKIQRALFIHDMDVRVWFPVSEVELTIPAMQGEDVNAKVQFIRTVSTEDEEKERSLRRWEWDWELRWKVIESMAHDDAHARAEYDYDVFLAGEDEDVPRESGGHETKGEIGLTVETDWEWSEDAMEVDAIL